MNATHGIAVVGSGGAIDALTTLMTGWHGMDTAHAGAAAFLIVTGATGIGYLLQRSRIGNWLFPPSQ